jgi:hypothetical protein
MLDMRAFDPIRESAVVLRGHPRWDTGGRAQPRQTYFRAGDGRSSFFRVSQTAHLCGDILLWPHLRDVYAKHRKRSAAFSVEVALVVSHRMLGRPYDRAHCPPWPSRSQPPQRATVWLGQTQNAVVEGQQKPPVYVDVGGQLVSQLGQDVRPLAPDSVSAVP